MSGPDTVSFAEIRNLIPELPGPDLDAATTATRRSVAVGGAARLGDLSIWLATWQGRGEPRLERPRICIFAGNHGIAAHAGSAGTRTAQRIQTLIKGDGALTRLCRFVDADLRVFEMALDQPTRDFTTGEALSEDACARAVAYGMMAFEPGIDLLCLGAMADGGSLAALAVVAGLSGLKVDTHSPSIAAAIERHRSDDPLTVLARLGGHEIAAITGTILAARLAKIPVILDGWSAIAAASVVHALDRHAIDHCQIALAIPGADPAAIVAQLGKTPLLGLGASEDECVGTALAISQLRAAVACFARETGA
jgi:nicotinate-nucleotide--dimethylbenzimidazole phosphoribosyltransferase